MTPRNSLFLTLACLGLATLLACGSATEPAAAATGGRGLVILDPASERDYFHDFGHIPDGEEVSHTFRIQNTDPQPVTIRDLTPACSCSVPAISYRDAAGELVRGSRYESPVITLPPGAVAELEIAVDTRQVKVKNVDKLSSVMLRCDSVNTPYLRFELHLVATQPWQVTPTQIDLGQVPVSSGGRGSADIITAMPGGANRILGPLDWSTGLTVDVFEAENTLEPLWRVEAALHPPLVLGPWHGELRLQATDAEGQGEGEPLVIRVKAEVVDDVIIFPQVLGFLPAREGAGLEARGTLRALAPGHRVRVVDALLQGGLPADLDVRYEAVDPDVEGRSSRWEVVVAAPAALDAELATGTLQLTLDDPELRPVEVQVLYRRPE